jgi:hypothetical protein
MSEDEHHAVHERWARLRFAVVGPLLVAPPEPGALQGALAALSAKHWRHPVSGEPVRNLSTTLRHAPRLFTEHCLLSPALPWVG